MWMCDVLCLCTSEMQFMWNFPYAWWKDKMWCILCIYAVHTPYMMYVMWCAARWCDIVQLNIFMLNIWIKLISNLISDRQLNISSNYIRDVTLSAFIFICYRERMRAVWSEGGIHICVYVRYLFYANVIFKWCSFIPNTELLYMIIAN